MNYKKFLISLAIVLLVVLLGAATVCLCLLYQRQKAPMLYKQGLELYKGGDYQNAYYNFSRVFPATGLYSSALYYQAKCADSLNDTQNAARKYSMLLAVVKDENAAPYFLWRLGNLSDGFAAKRYFLRLKREYGGTEYGIAANWELSKLTDDIEEKQAYLLDYIRYSPKGRFIDDVLTEILTPAYSLDGAQKVIVANGLYQNGQYSKAIALLKETPVELSWPLLVDILDKVKSGKNVLKVAEKGFSLDNSHFDEDTLLKAVLIYAKYYPKGAYSALEYIYKNAGDKRTKAIALYKLPQYLPQEKALRYRLEFYDNCKNSKFLSEVLWELFITSYENNKMALALKYGKEHAALFSDEYTPAVLYFLSQIQKKNNDPAYKNSAKTVINEYTHSYYAYLAYKNTLERDLSSRRSLKVPADRRPAFPYPSKTALMEFFENFAYWGDFAAFDDFRIKDPLVQSWLEYKKGNRALSIVLARDYIKENPQKRDSLAWKLAYPIYYAPEINNWAAKRGLSPFLTLALIKEESHFIPEIQSPAGAMGLMQIMPKTAEMVSGRKFSVDELSSENINIALGTLYFSDLMQIFSNNEPLCVLAYNSGPNAVKKWLNESPDVRFDIFTENIPYAETKNYIKKVYGAYWNYLLLYGDLRP